MNQQTGYALKSSMTTCTNNNPISISKESISPKQRFQNMPNVIEITMIMLGTILEENAKKMTQREIHSFYNIVNGLANITRELK